MDDFCVIIVRMARILYFAFVTPYGRVGILFKLRRHRLGVIMMFHCVGMVAAGRFVLIVMVLVVT